MTQFVRGGIIAAAARMSGIEQHACADRAVERIKTRYSRLQILHEHAHAELQFKQSRDIGNRPNAETEPLSNLESILFRLDMDIARKDRMLLRIVSNTADAQQALKLSFCSRQVG